MVNQAGSVGAGLSRALARADELKRSSGRRVRVRILTQYGDLDPGVIVVAHIAAKTGPELEAQIGKGVRYVPLADLDARAHQLPDLVDEAAAEIEAAVAAAPPPPLRPSLREGDFDTQAYEDLIERTYRAMRQVGDALAKTSTEDLSPSGVAEAVALGALKVAALAAIGGRMELSDLIDMLKSETRGLREAASELGGARVSVH